MTFESVLSDTAILLRRYMDLWPCTDDDRHYLQQLLGLGPGPSAGGPVSGQAPVQAQVPPSPPAASRQLPAQPPPPVLVPPPGPHQPITQIPRELGNLINALPPVHVSVTLLSRGTLCHQCNHATNLDKQQQR